MDESCTVYKTVDFISKKWTLLIILELFKGDQETLRYSEIRDSIPDITPKILSARLKELENQGIIMKKIDASRFPVKCEYSLTNSGKDFIHIIKDMKQWALKWRVDNELCEHLDCKDCDL